MATELREELAGLCREQGWSYGIFWRVGRGDSRLMTVECSYYEEHVSSVVQKLLNQVHVLGQGIIGGAITNDTYEWIFQDSYRKEPSMSDAWMQQFLAGIKTILIASLSSLGAIQFGSIKKIPKSLEFVDKVKQIFRLNAQTDAYFPDHCGASASTNFSGDAYINCCNSNSVDETDKRIAQSARTFTQESRYNNGFCSSMGPYAIPAPVTSRYADVSRDFCHQFHETPSICTSPARCLVNQTNAIIPEAEDQISSISSLFASSSCPDSSVAAFFDENSWTSSIDVPLMRQEFLNELGLQELPNLVPVNSCYPMPHDNSSVQISAASLTSNLCRLQDSMLEARTSNASKCFFSTAEGCSLPSGNLFDAATLCYVPSTASEPINTFADPSCLTSANSASVHARSDAMDHLTQLCNQISKQVACNVNMQTKKDLSGGISPSSGFLASNNNPCNMAAELIRPHFEKPSLVSSSCLESLIKSSSNAPVQQLTDNDLFDGMEFDISPNNFVPEYWDDIMMPNSCSKVSERISDLQIDSAETANKGWYSQANLEQLLGTLGGENVKNSSHTSLPTKLCPNDDPHLEKLSTVTNLGIPQVYKYQPSSAINLTPNLLASLKPEIICGSQKCASLKSSVSSWMDDSCSRNTGNSLLTQPKKAEEALKVVKKRARPGESTRPRPKDRQQIQDRVKELREIVPNCTKCSIDALLDRTIKHMLFLQSVTKYADKLKQADEPKLIVEDSGVVLKDNSGSTGSSGATWAYEVAGQTMVCPIIVEDLTPPGQMLVEMLCEEHGFFLEIADIIRGFGLTILKGVMETRECKIWARFLVEANREVTRMDIFLSLVQLLQQTSSIRPNKQANKAMEKKPSAFSNCQRSDMPISISLSDSAVM